MMVLESSTRLVLVYQDGQFTFRHFNPLAGHAEIFALAGELNGFREDAADLKRVLLVTVEKY